MTPPRGHCPQCGEPLRFTPCLNCATLRELPDTDTDTDTDTGAVR